MILMNDFRRQWADTRDASIAAFSEVGESGWYILGREVEEFEKALARCWGIAHAVGVGNGLDAIEISLRVLGCKPGDKVLTTPLSAFATTLAILKIGAIPVFVDTDEYGLIDLDACHAVLKSRHDIRFMVPVHLYGHAVNLDRLGALSRAFGCLIVEDCAQSIGAAYNCIPTGTAGRMAATSFYPTKNLGALGDGGAILTSSDALSLDACRMRDYGQSAKYRHQIVGCNSRLDELQAALMRRVSLPKLPCWIDARRRIAATYLTDIVNPALTLMGSPVGSTSCWHLFPLLTAPARKHHFISWLNSQGIATAEHYPILIPDQPALSGLPFEIHGELDNARRLCNSEVSLPIHPYLTSSEIDRVTEVCNGWEG
jgi:dTDP-3-amino-3,4,6-trideoxy-alpha-D-glucose transaminase